MKKAIAKTYSIEKIADIYLDVLAKNAPTISTSPTVDAGLVLPEVLRDRNIYFDEEIIAGAIQLLKDRKYIIDTGVFGEYLVTRIPGEVEVIIESTMRAFYPSPRYTDFRLTVKYYRITTSGARFVRLGQVIDVQGKVEREAERKKWKERLVTSGIALAVSVLTMVIKSFVFDK